MRTTLAVLIGSAAIWAQDPLSLREAVAAALRQHPAADLERARAIRAAGMSTDADVLSIQVHLAVMREQQIRRQAELEVARAAFNEALGLPLNTRHTLTTPLAPAVVSDLALEDYENRSLQQRSEARQAALAAELAETGCQAARAALLPQVVLHGAFETDRQRFITQGAANWLAAVSLRWNLFNGFADKQRIAESEHSLRRAQAERRRPRTP